MTQLKTLFFVIYLLLSIQVFSAQANELEQKCAASLVSTSLFLETEADFLCRMSKGQCQTKLLSKYVEKPGYAELLCHSYDNIYLALAMAIFDRNLVEHFGEALFYGTNNGPSRVKCSIDKAVSNSTDLSSAHFACSIAKK